MKQKKKVIFVILILFFLLFNLYVCTKVSADGVLVKDLVDYVKDNDMTIKKANRLTTVISFIIAFIQVACTGYAIITITVAGIRYFTVSSASGKIEGRKRLANAIMRALLIFSVGNFLKIIFVVVNPE